MVWDADNWEPGEFAACVIGTPWDYMQQPEKFMARLAEIAADTRLLNPLETVRWNYDKTYLQDLEVLGVHTVPTLWGTSADESTIQNAFDRWDTPEIVVKPTIGAGAWRQARLKRGAPLPNSDDLPPSACMLQPFLPAVASEGEYSFLFFGGEFSHCSLKVPKDGDYRVQAIFGAHEKRHQPSDLEVEQARSVLESVRGDLLYTRWTCCEDWTANWRSWSSS